MPLFGSLDSVHSIAGQLHPELSRACLHLYALANPETVEHQRFAALSPGERYVVKLNADRCYAIHECYIPKSLAAARLEYHRLNADIQFVMQGIESIAISPERHGTTSEPFNAEKDIGFIPMRENVSFVRMTAGMAMLIMPGELHAPGITVSSFLDPVFKCVVKINT